MKNGHSDKMNVVLDVKQYSIQVFKILADDKSDETKLLINCANQSLVAKLQSIGDAIRLN